MFHVKPSFVQADSITTVTRKFQNIYQKNLPVSTNLLRSLEKFNNLGNLENLICRGGLQFPARGSNSELLYPLERKKVREESGCRLLESLPHHTEHPGNPISHVPVQEETSNQLQ